MVKTKRKKKFPWKGTLIGFLVGITSIILSYSPLWKKYSSIFYPLSVLYLFAVFTVAITTMGGFITDKYFQKKNAQNLSFFQRIFYLNKSRMIILIIVFLLFPVFLVFPASHCYIFQKPGGMRAFSVCYAGPYPLILALISSIGILLGTYRAAVINPITPFITLIISFFLSYPLDLLYKKLRKKTKKRKSNWWRRRKYWQKGAILGFIVSIIILASLFFADRYYPSIYHDIVFFLPFIWACPTLL